MSNYHAPIAPAFGSWLLEALRVVVVVGCAATLLMAG